MKELDFSKPENLQTRDGRAVRIYATDGQGVLCVHGAFQGKVDGWIAWQWTLLGRAFVTATDCSHDLVPKPVRITGWLNIYKGTDGKLFPGCSFYSTEEESEHASDGAWSRIYIDTEIKKHGT